MEVKGIENEEYTSMILSVSKWCLIFSSLIFCLVFLFDLPLEFVFSSLWTLSISYTVLYAIIFSITYIELREVSISSIRISTNGLNIDRFPLLPFSAIESIDVREYLVANRHLFEINEIFLRILSFDLASFVGKKTWLRRLYEKKIVVIKNSSEYTHERYFYIPISNPEEFVKKVKKHIM